MVINVSQIFDGLNPNSGWSTSAPHLSFGMVLQLCHSTDHTRVLLRVMWFSELKTNTEASPMFPPSTISLNFSIVSAYGVGACLIPCKVSKGIISITLSGHFINIDHMRVEAIEDLGTHDTTHISDIEEDSIRRDRFINPFLV